MTRNEAISLMGVIAATWPQAVVSEDTVNAYATFLSDVEYQDAFAAIGRLSGTSRWMPSVSEIRETAAELKLGLPSAFIAWEQFVSRQQDRHALVRRVEKAMGGWSAYSMSDNPSIFRAHFLKLYGEARSEAVVGEASGHPMLPAPPEPLALTEHSSASKPLTFEEREELVRNLKATIASMKSP